MMAPTMVKMGATMPAISPAVKPLLSLDALLVFVPAVWPGFAAAVTVVGEFGDAAPVFPEPPGDVVRVVPIGLGLLCAT